MKYAQVFVLFLMIAFLASCRQNQTEGEVNIKSKIKNTVPSNVPVSMVRNVKKDRKGNILIASYRGVYRYDGKSFTNLTSIISSPSFWDVLEDRKGNLWLATRDSGVYYYNGKSFKHFTTREGLAGNNAFKIFEDKSGKIWFATGAGLSLYDGKSFRNFTTKDGLPKNDITTIMEDKTGKLWIGTTGEACLYDGKTFTVFRNKEGKAFTNVRSIIEDKKGNIWFGATIINDKKGDTLIVTVGLWRYDGRAFSRVSQRGASAIFEDKKGNIWTTGELKPNGAWVLSRYDQKSLYDHKVIVSEVMSVKKMLCGIVEANDGSIWFGSITGIYRYDGKTITDFKNKGQAGC